MTRTQVLLSALVAVLLIAMFWVLLFQPLREDLTEVEQRIADQQTEQVGIQQAIARLQSVRDEAPEVEAELAAAEAIVPRDPALPAALRQLQVAADDAGVILQAVTTERPAPIVDELPVPPPAPTEEPPTDDAPVDDEPTGDDDPEGQDVPVAPTPPAGPSIEGLSSIGISVQVLGGYFQVVDFLRRLEDPLISPRGVTWRDATIARDVEDAYPQLTVSLTGDVFAVITVPPPPQTEPDPAAPPVEGEDDEAEDATTDGDVVDDDDTDGSDTDDGTPDDAGTDAEVDS